MMLAKVMRNKILVLVLRRFGPQLPKDLYNKFPHDPQIIFHNSRRLQDFSIVREIKWIVNWLNIKSKNYLGTSMKSPRMAPLATNVWYVILKWSQVKKYAYSNAFINITSNVLILGYSSNQQIARSVKQFKGETMYWCTDKSGI